MKKFVIACMAIGTLVSCDNKVSKKIKETKDGITNTVKASNELSKMGDDIKELQELEPLTNDEMKAWLPEEINGMKRTGFKAGQTAYVQMASIEGTYKNEDKSKTFKVNILDGAGKMGASATAGIRMMLSMDMEEEDEYKTKRTVKKGDNKAIEEYRIKNNNTNIQLMHGKRFYIQAEGKNMDVEETWDAINELDLDELD